MLPAWPDLCFHLSQALEGLALSLEVSTQEMVQDSELMRRVMEYHIVPDRLEAGSLLDMETIPTMDAAGNTIVAYHDQRLPVTLLGIQSHLELLKIMICVTSHWVGK